MIVEIGCLDELDAGVTRGDLVGLAVDALDQHACERGNRERR